VVVSDIVREIARAGKIVDASIVAVPRQRNAREENEVIKRGRMPKDWETKLTKGRQTNEVARWTKGIARSFTARITCLRMPSTS
jgi:hypothetical protein